MMEEITLRNTIHSCLRFQYFETGWSTQKNIDNKYDKASIDVENQSFTCELTRTGMQNYNCSKRPTKSESRSLSSTYCLQLIDVNNWISYQMSKKDK